MVDSFDEFAKKHSQEQQDREKLANETRPEWAMLKSFTESLAMDGKGIEGYKFEWVSDDYSPRLVIGAVAATFLHRERNGKLVDCRIRFDRRPPGPNAVWVDDKSPFAASEWTLVPTVVGDSIQWEIAEVSAELNAHKYFSTADLAGKVGIKLAEFLLAYNKHYEKWSPV